MQVLTAQCVTGVEVSVPRIIDPARGGAGGLQLCDHHVTQVKLGPWASQRSGSILQ